MADEPARINSCTKSVLSALICAAVDRGLLPEPAAAPVSLFFPRLAADPDSRKHHMTLRHLLTMTSGFRWQEFGGLNSFPAMTRTPDWIAHVLEQPLSEPPGTKMTYNSGVSQLLSAILSQAAGTTTARFAELALFGPLGIEAYEWETDPQGIHTGGFGLRLRPSDLMKLGQLMLQRGVWGDARLFSPELADLAVRPVVRASPPYDGLYAWHWWCGAYTPGAGKAGQPTGEPWDLAQDEAAEAIEPPPGSVGREQREDREGRRLNDDSIVATAPSRNSLGRDSGAAASEEAGDTMTYCYAKGFGGQFVYVVPQAEVVAVVTQDSRKRKQPDLFAEVIAPAILGN